MARFARIDAQNLIQANRLRVPELTRLFLCIPFSFFPPSPRTVLKAVSECVTMLTLSTIETMRDEHGVNFSSIMRKSALTLQIACFYGSFDAQVYFQIDNSRGSDLMKMTLQQDTVSIDPDFRFLFSLKVFKNCVF